MTTLQSVLPLLPQGCWMVTLDLKDAYFLRHHLSLTITLFKNVGIAIIFKKSCLEPVQCLQYIGAVLNSIQVMSYLSLDRAETIITLTSHICNNPRTSVLHVQRLLGHMAASVAVLPHARLRICPLQLWFILNYRTNSERSQNDRCIPYFGGHCWRFFWEGPPFSGRPRL